ncbi:hypothetical protein AJ79_08774 [Helicocarpus griseus UAMH5409]|uniref:Protein kinase domain-containing protein n=1 Tax=Helicocarpus griseus UAMH5409 TaxID=1447875 RepID=A0A2B7WQ35_9EURO|nr:hypothetical protein AJ79_08774 [Helicocarpus griseus UAMH5409]
MEIGTAFAAIQFADQCIKYGRKLVRRCQNYRHAEAEIHDLMLSIEHNWMKTEAQINFLKRIAGTLEPSYCDVQSRVLSELEGKLKTATLTMDQLIMHAKEERRREVGKGEKDLDVRSMTKALQRMAPRKKLKYAFDKERLESMRDDLESWQRRFDPSWMLTMRIADSLVDEQLQQEEEKPQQSEFIMAAKGVRDAAREPTSSSFAPVDGSIFKPPTTLSPHETQIPFSHTVLGQLADSKEQVLIDTMACNHAADMNRTMRDVRKLARILSKVDPSTFSLLACKGVVNKGTERPTFRFLFSIPLFFSSPTSLRALLIESNPRYPLNDRLDLAKQLTSSVLFIHSSQFVHKNIRPETTIIFRKKGTEGRCDLDTLCLVGFEKFRPAEGMTYLTSDGLWHHDLYRHPTRQGTRPEEEYQMQHDIYSLGVVLLELGLWQSFITYPSPQPYKPDAEIAPIPPSFVAQHSPQKNHLKRASDIKAHLVLLAAEMLPAKMGTTYADIVLSCLRCLDRLTWSGQADDAGEAVGLEGGGFENVVDDDGIIIGVKYIEKILLRMQQIRV